MSTHILLSSQSNEWYTPSIYVEAAREAMGSIDLDPASCEIANRVVRAREYYTKEGNGLNLPFFGNVWCNPPYGTTNGKSNQGIWTRRLLAEYEMGHIDQAVILVNAQCDTKWFHALLNYPICLTKGRVNFYTAKMVTQKGSTHGSAFVYLGPHEQRFIDTFSRFGRIVKSIDASPVRQPILL